MSFKLPVAISLLGLSASIFAMGGPAHALMVHEQSMLEVVNSIVPNDADDNDLRTHYTDAELFEALGAAAANPQTYQDLQSHEPDQADTGEDEGEPGVADDANGLVNDVRYRYMRRNSNHFVPKDDKRSLLGGLFKGKAAGHGSDQSAPIWSSFISNLKSCAPGCVPANYGTWGTRGRFSCHNSGKAIDVGAIVCGGSTFPAIKNGRFATMVTCMQGKMKVLFHNGKGVTEGHFDHAHFSNGCREPNGHEYW